jgi:hypothetical protein
VLLRVRRVAFGQIIGSYCDRYLLALGDVDHRQSVDLSASRTHSRTN